MFDNDTKSAREGFRSLSFAGKISHLLRYYWLQSLIVIALLAALISYIGHLTWAKEKEACLGVAIHANIIDTDLVLTWPEHLDQTYPDLTKQGKEAFKVYTFYSGYTGVQQEEAVTEIYRLAAYIQTDMLDVMIGDEETMRIDGETGYLMDLTQVFTQEELDQIRSLSDPYSKDGDTGILSLDITKTSDTGRVISTTKQVPLLISVRGADALFDETFASRPIYIGIVNGTPHLDNAKEFILQLLGSYAPAANP
ncbi:MAG: hypothetical protein J6P72_08300 [Firmicutes bacterium]|nr:hypothetical protein [Bacillota bacterium]